MKSLWRSHVRTSRPPPLHGGSTNTTTFAIIAIDCTLEQHQIGTIEHDDLIDSTKNASWGALVLALSPEMPKSNWGVAADAKLHALPYPPDRLITNASLMTMAAIRYAISKTSASGIRLGVDCGDAARSRQVTSSFGNNTVLLTMNQRGISVCSFIWD